MYSIFVSIVRGKCIAGEEAQYIRASVIASRSFHTLYSPLYADMMFKIVISY